MEPRAWLELIEQKKKELGLSDNKIEQMAKHPSALKNLRKAVKTGKGAPNMRTLMDLARVLEIESPTLLRANAGIPCSYTAAIERLEAEISGMHAEITGMHKAIEILKTERDAVKKPK